MGTAFLLASVAFESLPPHSTKDGGAQREPSSFEQEIDVRAASKVEGRLRVSTWLLLAFAILVFVSSSAWTGWFVLDDEGKCHSRRGVPVDGCPISDFSGLANQEEKEATLG
jgi:hypothetical protein